MKFTGWTIRILFVCVAISMMGCIQEAEVLEPTGPPAPLPPTPQEIAQSIITEAQLDMRIPPKNTRFPKAIENNLLSILSKAKSANSQTESGREAIQHVILRIDRRIREFADAEAWTHVMVFIKARAVFEPNNQQYLALIDDAKTELRKPVVTVRGLPDIDGVQLVILDFHIPLSDETFRREKLRLGDKAHGIKILSIFGKRRGVMLQYMETGEKYVAFLPGQE